MRIDTIVENTRLSTADMGEYAYQRFIQWAFVERQSKAAFSRNILVSRVGENREAINEGLQFYSNRYGITVEELQNKIAALDAERKSISQIHEALEEEFRNKQQD